MKFKENDRVIVIRNGTHLQNIGDTGVIIDIAGITQPYKVKMDKDNDCWWFEEDEIELYKFKVGNIVEMDKQKTLGDLIANHWNGCKTDTLRYIENRYSGQSKVTKVIDDGTVELDYDLLVNVNILKPILEREMTKDEIEKELGYKIKII